MAKIRYFLFWCLCAVMAVPVMHAEHLMIIAVNDTHSQIDPTNDGKGGVARRRAIYDKLRAENPNTVLIHAGDAVQGTLYFSLYKGEVEYSLMDSLGYDVIILGNHEFDNGMESLAQYYKDIDAAKISANYDFSATPLNGMFQPYWIKAVGDKRVAFFGINVNPEGLIADMNCKQLGYRYAPGVADATARYLKEVLGMDYAIMVSHIGYSSYEPTEPNDTLIIRRSHYIDMVISSHSHTTIKPGSGDDRIPNADGKLIPIGQNGKSGKLVATYDLDLESGEIVYNQIPVDESWDEAANSYTAMNEWLSLYRHGVDSIMNNPVGTSARFMKNSSQAAQNWVSDATMDIIKELSGIKNIDCAIMNKGGIRADMPQGTVTEGVIGSMFPFDNRFVVLNMPGTELIECMKLMCARGGDAVSREIHATYNENGELIKASVKGKKIEPEKNYIVATIDYLANGGDYMTPMTSCVRLFVDTQKYGNHILNYIKNLEAAGKKIDAKDEVRIKLKK
ncbi:MAG: 5'-nucleotidase C-terminal domain-containing protein [Muribaculaceae bacterium]|nr:5'-nucleotidase C-terminal domain-containing protein [Muribaculaceae bacterium]